MVQRLVVAVGLECWRVGGAAAGSATCICLRIYIGTYLGFKFLVPDSDPSRNVWILNFNTQNHFIFTYAV